jgi:hypothetical protein
VAQFTIMQRYSYEKIRENNATSFKTATIMPDFHTKDLRHINQHAGGGEAEVTARVTEESGRALTSLSTESRIHVTGYVGTCVGSVRPTTTLNSSLGSRHSAQQHNHKTEIICPAAKHTNL